MRSEVVWVNVLIANVVKVLIEMRRYLPNTISLVVTFYVIFLAMFLGVSVVGDPAAADTHVRFLLVGNAVWFLLMVGVNSIGWEVTSEATRGTLEQLHMSPVAPRWILLSRLVANLGVHLLIVTAMLVASMATARTYLAVDVPLVLALLGPMSLGVTGLAFAVAGLALVYKQIQAMLQVSQFVFLGMAFVPLSVAPWLELAPVVKGIDMLRASLVHDVGFAGFGALDWASLALNGVVYFVLGLVAYGAAERRATARGLLGRY
jgi:ABC-2 type transport system permease protein